MILLDTTVLVYAVGRDHPLREPCRNLVRALSDGRLRATTTPEVIQEFAHVRARRATRPEAAALATDFARLLAPLVVIEEEDLEAGMALFASGSSVGAFDAVLAAAALRRDADALVSADRAFATVQALAYVDPARPGLLDTLTDR